MGIRNAEGYMDVVLYQAMANVDREMKASRNVNWHFIWI